MSSARIAFLVGAGVLLGVSLARPAQAQEVVGPRGDVPPVSEAPMGMYSVKRGVQGPAGLVHSRVLLHINTSKNAVGKPVSLAPDIWYSVSDVFQLGILHNGPMGWQTRPGAGLCLSGKSNGCPEVYDNIGFDALYGLAFGDFHFSLHSSLYILSFQGDTPLQLTLGAATKLHLSDQFAIFLDPAFGIGLNSRDTNKDWFYLPVEFQFQAVPPVAFKLLTGVLGPLSGFGDNYQIPLGLGVIGNLSEAIDLGIRFSFDNLLGKIPPGLTRTSWSSLSLLMHVRF
jgi:hypothetical protein